MTNSYDPTKGSSPLTTTNNSLIAHDWFLFSSSDSENVK